MQRKLKIPAIPALVAALVLSSTTVLAQEQALTPEEERAVANAEQAAEAKRQIEENLANKQAHDEAVRARLAEIERQQREYELAMARWRAEACKAGREDFCTAQ